MGSFPIKKYFECKGNDFRHLLAQMGKSSDYFDYERYGRELFMYDYNMGANGNVFRRI